MKIQTSENVKFAALFFRLARSRAGTTSLEEAKGRITNETKKEGMLVAVANLSTASTMGAANTAAIAVPRSRINTALQAIHLGFPLPCSTPASLCFPKNGHFVSVIVCLVYILDPLNMFMILKS